jgi:hypothetical protein
MTTVSVKGEICMVVDHSAYLTIYSRYTRLPIPGRQSAKTIWQILRRTGGGWVTEA